jgi:dipeptidyl aminopeptidase/acylaminoacyl peptidase
MNPDGSGQVNRSKALAHDDDPAWSADGARIAFRATRDGNDEIYVMNADGSNPDRLTDDAASDRDPSWSPDGTRIAFTSERDGNANVYVMNADGSGVAQLTDDPSGDFRPAWSPDGTLIAFESTRDERTSDRDVFVMNADGSDERRLRVGAENARDVDWQPTVDLSLELRRAGRTVVARVANLSPARAQRVQVTFTSGKRRVVRTIGTIEPDASRTASIVEPRRTRAVANGWHVDPNPGDNRRTVRAR